MDSSWACCSGNAPKSPRPTMIRGSSINSESARTLTRIARDRLPCSRTTSTRTSTTCLQSARRNGLGVPKPDHSVSCRASALTDRLTGTDLPRDTVFAEKRETAASSEGPATAVRTIDPPDNTATLASRRDARYLQTHREVIPALNTARTAIAKFVPIESADVLELEPSILLIAMTTIWPTMKIAKVTIPSIGVELGRLPFSLISLTPDHPDLRFQVLRKVLEWHNHFKRQLLESVRPVPAAYMLKEPE